MKRALLIVALVLLTACSLRGGGSAQATASGSPSVTPLRPPAGQLDAEVAMPPNFPGDVPVYTGARLTAAASFNGQNGEVTWGMEWETLDDGTKVIQFYTTKLNQGDWTTSRSSPSPSPGGAFSTGFSRKSNPRFAGTVGVDAGGGVTKISMSLVSPGG